MNSIYNDRLNRCNEKIIYYAYFKFASVIVYLLTKNKHYTYKLI